MRTKPYDEWMQSLEGRIGTHYDGCFMNHPECAALVGERAATEQIVKWLRRPAVYNEDASWRQRAANAIERNDHMTTEEQSHE